MTDRSPTAAAEHARGLDRRSVLGLGLGATGLALTTGGPEAIAASTRGLSNGDVLALYRLKANYAFGAKTWRYSASASAVDSPRLPAAIASGPPAVSASPVAPSPSPRTERRSSPRPGSAAAVGDRWVMAPPENRLGDAGSRLLN